MTATIAAPTLSDLIAYLDGLSGGPRWTSWSTWGRSIDPAELAPHVRFSSQGYTRTWCGRVRGTICWSSAGRTASAARSTTTPVRSLPCACLAGVATETAFVFAPHGRVKAVGSRDLAAGTICGGQDLDVHQVSNLQDGDAELATLHVYSPPLRRMGTYSLTDDSRPGADVRRVQRCRRDLSRTPGMSASVKRTASGFQSPRRTARYR